MRVISALPGKEKGLGSSQESAVRINLLGRFEVRRDDVVLLDSSWPFARSQAILKLLALGPGHSMHREQIADVIWADLHPAAAANNLRKNLHLLRRRFAEVGCPDLIEAKAGTISLAAEASVDVDEFRERVDCTCEESAASLLRAISLYRGELLEDDPYEDWLQQPREALRSDYLRALGKSAATCERTGQMDRAIDLVQMIVDKDPLNEAACRRLMQLLVDNGRRAHAIRVYKQMERTLDRELDTRPDALTVQLYTEIRDGAGIRGMAAVEPPDAHRHNLPEPLTRFIGRRRETSEIARLLLEEPLVTLIGAGGCGKTRLAVETARGILDRYPDGIWLVDLAPIVDADLVDDALRATLGLVATPGQPAIDTLQKYLGKRRALLILDNCEHLAEAAAKLAEMIASSCPDCRVISTSRKKRGVRGEYTWTVPPLSLPDPAATRPNQLLDSDAAKLFVDRAAAVMPGFTASRGNARAIAALCRALDGLPLAIELAASRVNAIGVSEMEQRVGQLVGVAGAAKTDPRHDTMRAALDWSYRLLTLEQQTLLRRLSVFAGGFQLEQAEIVCAGEDLSESEVLPNLIELIDHSMVTTLQLSEGGIRYKLLEPVRQYATLMLAEASESAIQRIKHAHAYQDLVEERWAEIAGPQSEGAYRRILLESDNIRVSIRLLFEVAEHETLCLFMGRLGSAWLWAGRPGELYDWATAAHGLDGLSDYARGLMLHQLAWAEAFLGQPQKSLVIMDDALRLLSKGADDWFFGYTLGSRSVMSILAGDADGAELYANRSLSVGLDTGQKFVAGNAEGLLWLAALMRSDEHEALERAARFRACIPDIDDLHAATCFFRAALIQSMQGEFGQALLHTREAIEHARKSGDNYYSTAALALLAVAVSGVGRHSLACTLLAAAHSAAESTGLDPQSLIPPPLQQGFDGMRSHLTEDEFRKAWQRGTRLTRKEAFDFALSPRIATM